MKIPETLFTNHHFPSEIIQYAVWLYFVFPLSFRDVELLLHQGVHSEMGAGIIFRT